MITVRVTAGSETDVESALRLLTQNVPVAYRDRQIQENLTAARNGELPLQGLLLAERDGKPVGAMLSIEQEGGCGSLWPPEVVGEDEEAVDALMQASINRLLAADNVILQSILDPKDRVGRERLERNGIPYLTDLIFMDHVFSQEPPISPETRLEYETYTSATHHRFVELLGLTYGGTLDCPELEGIRSAEEALASHRASGEFHPEYWRLYRETGRDVGVVLLAKHPDQWAWELVYMGVAPEERGRGWGERMLQEAIAGLPQERPQRIFLAVDTRNHYALKAYEALDFQVIDRRALHLRLQRR